MKRIISACIEQTTRFETSEEPAAFKASLDRKSVKYRIFDEQPQSDKSTKDRCRRLCELPQSKQEQISKKYYGGAMPWKKNGGM